jgi:hypothetical protein
MAKYILLGPREPTAGVVSLVPQFQSKTSVFLLSNWEVQDPLEQEWWELGNMDSCVGGAVL